MRKQRRQQKRCWYLPPDGFRELRLSCLMSQRATAAYLGVSLRTIQHWDAGRHKVPWSTVRLLRLCRQGDLGAVDDHWKGFRIVRDALVTPDGRCFTVDALRLWWSTAGQARLWREAYDAAHPQTCRSG